MRGDVMKNKLDAGWLSVALLLAACGGGGGGGSGSGGNLPSPTSGNSVTMTVDSGPSSAAGQINMPYVSVTVCAPGGANCQVVDHVLVDTGSTGLRVLASELTPALLSSLGQQQVGGRDVAECANFASGATWGAVKLADIKLGGAVASATPFQLVSDPVYGNYANQYCTGSTSNMGSLLALGAKGIIGVSQATSDSWGSYYLCAGVNSCQAQSVAGSVQVANPVAALAGDNNGVLLQLPAVLPTGAPSAQGTLTFGVATQSNNAIPASAQVFSSPAGAGYTVSTSYTDTLGVARVGMSAFLDSGSNGLFFPDSGLAQCAGWYCPPSTRNLSARIYSGGAASTVAFAIGNSQTQFASNNSALPSLGGAASGVLSNQFDWGLPFFYGRSVFIGFDGRAIAGVGYGPVYIF
ncbi:hypothetical protein CEK28_04030 [Xenophilus sp. AP218F]|nr:hypothetical protein CEK28_04030 [Xenophilus sp. AP218F]